MRRVARHVVGKKGDVGRVAEPAWLASTCASGREWLTGRAQRSTGAGEGAVVALAGLYLLGRPSWATTRVGAGWDELGFFPFSISPLFLIPFLFLYR